MLLQIMIPPLRERKEDILLSFKEFMKEDYLRVGRREGASGKLSMAW
ncbi:MAG: hypothetical protein ACLTK0_04845 [Anaerovoracaceae bacterium]